MPRSMLGYQDSKCYVKYLAISRTFRETDSLSPIHSEKVPLWYESWLLVIFVIGDIPLEQKWFQIWIDRNNKK